MNPGGDDFYVSTILRASLFFLLICIMGGCGTVSSRGAHRSPVYSEYYKGSLFDFELLSFGDTLNDGNPRPQGLAIPSVSLVCWVTIICPIVTIFSIPADVVIDTVLLPYDMYHDR